MQLSSRSKLLLLFLVAIYAMYPFYVIAERKKKLQVPARSLILGAAACTLVIGVPTGIILISKYCSSDNSAAVHPQADSTHNSEPIPIDPLSSAMPETQNQTVSSIQQPCTTDDTSKKDTSPPASPPIIIPQQNSADPVQQRKENLQETGDPLKKYEQRFKKMEEKIKKTNTSERVKQNKEDIQSFVDFIISGEYSRIINFGQLEVPASES